MEKKWWHSSVVYQIYPRSFCDSNGDGIGDLGGIISKLDYLKELGIDAIWLSPVFKSPNDDNGYDISDYRDIMDEFGTMEDMQRLIDEGNKRGIKMIMDLVVNHTSDEHAWFVEARSSKDSAKRDFYIWRDPAADGGAPTAKRSVFSGSAWQYDEKTNQYYLHNFSTKQPDLNWDNPEVRKEVYDLMNFWIDKGIGGFRMDVINMIAKDPETCECVMDEKLHGFLQEMNREAHGRKELLTVGEAWGTTPDMAIAYSDPARKELSMVFQFEHIEVKYIDGDKWHIKPEIDMSELKRVMHKWQTSLADKGWNSLFWNNHDLPRVVSNWGNDSTEEYRVLSGKMLATLLHGLKGTPYIYQGEEIGMTNVKFPSINDYEDIEIHNMYKERIENGEDEAVIMEGIYKSGRDNARTPMQWNDSAYAGFSTAKPWLAVNPNYTDINVEKTLADKDSIFYHYKRLVEIRKNSDVIVYGDFALVDENNPKVFAYTRSFEGKRVLVVCNFYPTEVTFTSDIAVDSAKVLVSNYKDSKYGDTMHLRPYEAVMFEL